MAWLASGCVAYLLIINSLLNVVQRIIGGDKLHGFIVECGNSYVLFKSQL